MPEGAYVVDIKPSARRVSATVGRYVRDEGGRRRFPDREAAEEWAAAASDDGVPVWVRDANPNDEAEVDGYLMATPSLRRTGDDGPAAGPGGPGPAEAADGAGDDAEQGGLELYGVDVVADPHESDQLPLERFDRL